jgi:hypothetical protein
MSGQYALICHLKRKKKEKKERLKALLLVNEREEREGEYPQRRPFFGLPQPSRKCERNRGVQ